MSGASGGKVEWMGGSNGSVSYWDALWEAFSSCLGFSWPYFVFPQVNLKVKHVEYDTFYISEISSLVDIQEDYLMWFLHQAGMVRILIKLILQL